MKRPMLKLGAIVGATAFAAFAAGPAFAATGDTAGADSSASTGTGSLFELLDTDACIVDDTAQTTSGTPTGRCGDGLNLNDQINAFSQNASAPGDGTSSADASVAPIDITDFGALDLTGILSGLQAINTGTVLDDIIQGLDDAILQAALEALVPTVITPLDDAVQDALATVGENLPVSLELGAVESQCTATAQPRSAEGNGTVAGIDLLVEFGGQQINVPITAGTAPNSNLLVGAPQDLVDDIIQGLKDTFTASLGGALVPLNDLLDTLQTQVTNALFDQLEPTLLQALADALEPLIAGTVNKQVPVSPSSTGEIEVTSLELILLSDNVLELGRTHCGPNSRAGGDTGGPGDDDGDDDLPEVPTVVDSGVAGNGDNTARNVLGATAALMLLAGTAGLMGYRRMLNK